MSAPRRVLFGGDTHGDYKHVNYYFAMARENGCDAVFVLGDFGFWEHHSSGEKFLDSCSTHAVATGIPLFWLDGNHENHTLLRERYLDNPVTVDEWGFVQIRDGLWHAPRAHRWSWHETRFLALGGAYSVDKAYRVTGQSWWPEEEISPEEAELACAGGKVDVLLVHDKPLTSTPPWNRKNMVECIPNQRLIQRVVDVTHPELLLHGHLHLRYTDEIHAYGERDGEGVWYSTRVEGLDCNASARYDSGYPYRPEGSWYVLDLADIPLAPLPELVGSMS